MVAGDPNHFARSAGRGHAEAVALALDDEHGHGDRLELVQPVLRRLIAAGWRLERKRQTKDCRRGGRLRGAAGDTRAC